MRENNRQFDQMRDISIVRNFTKHAHGSVLISYGDTKVLCTAYVENKVPHFLRDSGEGWITAEYSMLPTATHTRNNREVKRGKPTGRTSEIQRLIGRSLRAAIDFEILGEKTIYIDADVLQADGGTRTASITGSMVALYDAVQYMLAEGYIKENPIVDWVGAVSVGKHLGKVICDLDYEEDSNAEMDMNIVMTESGKLVEVQGTAEKQTFSRDDLTEILDTATVGLSSAFTAMKEAIK